MENIKSFLETSTIHGLSYISTTGKYIRLFWSFVVITGFSGAGFLIYQSFQGWEESPVKTTIETLPVEEITLPKVTVCPPKNTYTNLNFDMMLTEHMTLDNGTRNELTQYAVGLIQDHVYNDIMTNISLLEEENRYYNWYMGYTWIKLPFWGTRFGCIPGNSECDKNRLRYHVNTQATSGNISTKYFGKKFNEDNVEKNLKYFLYIYQLSKSHQNNKSITLNFEMEGNFLYGVDRFWDGSTYRSDGETKLTKKYSPPGSKRYFSLERLIPGDQIREQKKIDSMPGVKIKWYYNNKDLDSISYTKYNDNANSYSEFRR